MKVCMLVRSTYDHDTRVRREARTLADAGHVVTVLALPASSDDDRVRERDGAVTVVRVRSVPLKVWRAVWEWVRPWFEGQRAPSSDTARALPAAPEGAPEVAQRPSALRHVVGSLLITLRERRRDRAFRRYARLEAADVYHAHDADTVAAARGAARRAGAALVYDAHELVVGETEGRSWRSRARLGMSERRHIKAADAVITVCLGIAEELARRYRIPTPVVLRNIPPRPAGEDLGLRRLADVPADRRVALFLGMASIERGVGTMLQALPALPQLDLVIMGPQFDGHLAAVWSVARQAGVDERVSVLPPVAPDHIVPTARAADVGLVLPHDVSLNHRYSLPNKLFEYIGAGLPVVASDLPELRRIVEGYGLGRVCDPTDPSAVADAIAEVLSSPQYAERSRAASDELCWEREQQRLLDVYARLGRPA